MALSKRAKDQNNKKSFINATTSGEEKNYLPCTWAVPGSVNPDENKGHSRHPCQQIRFLEKGGTHV